MKNFGRFIDSVRFRFAGDEPKAKLLIGFARKLLGALVHDAQFNKLKQAYRTYRFEGGVVIDLAMIPGMQEIGIYVPYEERRGRDEDICTGFIVTISRGDLEADYRWYVAPVALEPGMEDVEVPIPYSDNNIRDAYYYGTDEGNWLWPQPPSGWSSTYEGVNNEWVEHWTGDVIDGFFKRTNERYFSNNYSLALNEESDELLRELPPTGPRIINLLDGSSNPYPFDFIPGTTWAVTDTDVNTPYIDIITGNADYDLYHDNVDYVNQLMLQGVGKLENYREGIGGKYQHWLTSTEDYLLAFWGTLTQTGDSYYMTLPDGAITYEGVPTLPHYATVALLPRDTVIYDDGPYDYTDDPDYEDFEENQYPTGFMIYSDWFDRVLEIIDPTSLPPIPGSGYLEPPQAVIPNTLIAPALEGIVFYKFNNTWSFGNRTLRPAVPSNAKAGYYRIEIPAWYYAGGQYRYNEANERRDGVEYDVTITLFGSKFVAQRDYHGITGQQFDKFRILVNTPIEFDPSNPDEVFARLLMIDR